MGRSHRLQAIVRDSKGAARLDLEEERATPHCFRAQLVLHNTEVEIGRVEDRLRGGRIRTHVELDLEVPQVLVWALAAILADLARLRRSGWPDVSA